MSNPFTAKAKKKPNPFAAKASRKRASSTSSVVPPTRRRKVDSSWVKKGMKITVTWRYYPEFSDRTTGSFTGKVTAVKPCVGGTVIEIRDKNNVMFRYPDYLMEKIERARRA